MFNGIYLLLSLTLAGFRPGSQLKNHLPIISIIKKLIYNWLLLNWSSLGKFLETKYSLRQNTVWLTPEPLKLSYFILLGKMLRLLGKAFIYDQSIIKESNKFVISFFHSLSKNNLGLIRLLQRIKSITNSAPKSYYSIS